MHKIDEVLKKYEEDLKKAEEGQCKKVAQSIDFRNKFQKQFKDEYQPQLEEIRNKLSSKKHAVKIEEKPSEEIFYGFSLAIVPRHLLECPADRYHPSSLWSLISFTANEHSLSVDVKIVVRPNIEKIESNFVEKIPKDDFNQNLLMQKVSEFLQTVFDDTIVLDFK